MHTTELYFEAHITIEPSERQCLLAVIGQDWGFRPASFLQKKNGKFIPDDFMTGRSKSYEDLHDRAMDCVEELQYQGFTVTRYKIENTLLDVRL
jgi:hypothetical protein